MTNVLNNDSQHEQERPAHPAVIIGVPDPRTIRELGYTPPPPPPSSQAPPTK